MIEKIFDLLDELEKVLKERDFEKIRPLLSRKETLYKEFFENFSPETMVDLEKVKKLYQREQEVALLAEKRKKELLVMRKELQKRKEALLFYEKASGGV